METVPFSVVAGDDVEISVTCPTGFCAGKTFSLEFKRHDGSFGVASSLNVDGDVIVVSVDSSDSAGVRQGWLFGQFQISTPTVKTLFRLDLLFDADTTGSLGGVGDAFRATQTEAVELLVVDNAFTVQLESVDSGGVSAGGIEFHIGPPPPASDPVDPDGPNCLACFDPEGGPTGEGNATLSFAIEGFWSPAFPFYIPAGLGAPPPGALDPASYDRLYIETDTATLWLATPSAWVAVTGGGGGGPYDAAGAAAAAQAAAIAAAATDATAKADAKVADAINDGVTTVAPSQNAVFDALATKADLASPALTGNPTAPTQTVGDNSTRIATTAFVAAAAALKMSTESAPLIRLPAPTRLSATGGMVGGLLVPVVGSSTHNIPVGNEFLGRCHHSGQTAGWLGFNVSANALTAGQSIIIAVYDNAPDNGPGILLSSQSLVVGTTTGDLIFSSGVSLTFPVGACYVSVINPSTNAGTITIRSGTFYSPHFGVVQNGTWGGPMKRTGVTAPASDLSSIQLRSSIGSNEINVDAGTTFPVLLGRTA